MKKKIKTFIIFNILSVIVLSSITLLYADSGEASVELPSVQTFVVNNGVKVFYIKDELPQLTIVISVGSGKMYEKKENAGIFSLIAKTLSISGSKKYPGASLHEKIDSLGGKISISSSWENTLISIKVLKRFKSEAFDIITDLIANPNFNSLYLETARAIIIDDIKRKYDDSANIAFEKAREIIFNGDGYGAVPTEEKIKLYSLKKIIETWNKYFKAKNMLIGISTSISYSEIKDESEKKFSIWQPGEKIDYSINLKEIKESISKNKSKIFFYPKDLPQATIVTGTIAPNINYKGNYALSVMNYILGGGSFNSRLMKDIRVKRGLAYVVQSIIRARYKTGVFLAFAQTGNKTVVEVLSIILENFKKMSQQNISIDELNWAKKSISNSYIFMFDTPMNILSNYIEIEFNNLPDDYFKKYLENIEILSGKNILYESKILFESGLINVVVGKPELKDDLKKFGEVVVIK